MLLQLFNLVHYLKRTNNLSLAQREHHSSPKSLLCVFVKATVARHSGKSFAQIVCGQILDIALFACGGWANNQLPLLTPRTCA